MPTSNRGAGESLLRPAEVIIVGVGHSGLTPSEVARKFGRYSWNTQVNINNAFDSVTLIRMPDVTTGRIIDARLDADYRRRSQPQPRR